LKEVAMKKTALLNRDVSEVIASLGHTDMLIVCDAGFPVPPGVRRIDLAVTANLPPFLETLKTILTELEVEKTIVAEETTQVSPDLFQKIVELFLGLPMDTMPHIEFKKVAREARAAVRTGEFTPYANIILVCGVPYA
jgi:D-ribose pyranase